MVEKKRVYNIDVTLSGEAQEHFLAIKKAKGLTDNAEVVRLIINWYAEKLADKRSLGKQRGMDQEGDSLFGEGFV
jgi:hypothetical protein